MFKYLISAFFFLISFVAQGEIATEDLNFSVYYPTHPESANSDIPELQKFSPLTTRSLRPVARTAWLKIDWDKNRVKEPLFLINEFTSQSLETYYLIKDGKVVQHYEGGYTRDTENRPIEHFNFVTPVDDVDYILLKTCCNFSVPTYFRLLTQTEMHRQYYESLIFHVAIYAVILAMIFYNLFIYLYLRYNRYLYYIGYVSMLMLIQLRQSGLSSLVLPSVFGFIPGYIANILGLATFLLLFQRSFLSKEYLSNIDNKIINITLCLIWTPLLIYFLPFVPHGQETGIGLTQISLLGAFIIANYLVIKHLFKGDKNARVLFITLLVITIAAGIGDLRYNGVIENTFWLGHSMDFAMVFEAIVLSVVLAQKIQSLRQEKIDAEIERRVTQQLFSHKLLKVQEREKSQIGSAIHDGFSHKLLILKKDIEDELGKHSDEVQLLGEIIDEVRDLSRLLHPHLLKLGIKPALTEMITRLDNRHHVEFSLVIDDIELNPEQRILLYRIVQESLNNVIKHAHASECLISIRVKDKRIHLLIKDDGRGFNINTTIEGLGLRTLNERAEMLGGKIKIYSSTDEEGTCIRANFPLDSAESTTLGDIG